VINILSITFTSINKSKLKSLIIIRKSNSRFHICIHLYIIHMDCLLLVMNISSLIYYQSLSSNASPASFSRETGNYPSNRYGTTLFHLPFSVSPGKLRGRPETDRRIRCSFPTIHDLHCQFIAMLPFLPRFA
jgi:hypothetical protein